MGVRQMATVIFVHGTSVRKEGFDAGLAVIRKGLGAAMADRGVSPPAIDGCLWGDSCGVRLNKKGKSVPEYEGTGGAGAPAATGDDMRSLWEMLLYYDPLFELQGLALRDKRPAPPTGAGDFKEKVNKLPGSVSVDLLMQGGITAAIFKEACEAVARERVLGAALLTSRQTTECAMATARAVVAQAVFLSPAWPRPALVSDRNIRDLIVAAAATPLGTPQLSLAWAANKLKAMGEDLLGAVVRSYVWLGAAGGMPLVRKRKGKVTDGAALFAGDILLYQARGGAIRAEIRKRREAAAAKNPPVVLLGHSLGGIARVDLLATERLSEVPLLVTVGSQAPLLYEINALPSLEYGDPLPDHFVDRWVNVYDPRDLLSYLTEGVFTAETRARTTFRDVEVDNGLRFPESHSGYWANPATWGPIAEEIARL
jgi:hypothetical protein